MQSLLISSIISIIDRPLGAYELKYHVRRLMVDPIITTLIECVDFITFNYDRYIEIYGCGYYIDSRQIPHGIIIRQFLNINHQNYEELLGYLITNYILFESISKMSPDELLEWIIKLSLPISDEIKCFIIYSFPQILRTFQYSKIAEQIQPLPDHLTNYVFSFCSPRMIARFSHILTWDFHELDLIVKRCSRTEFHRLDLNIALIPDHLIRFIVTRADLAILFDIIDTNDLPRNYIEIIIRRCKTFDLIETILEEHLTLVYMDIVLEVIRPMDFVNLVKSTFNQLTFDQIGVCLRRAKKNDLPFIINLFGFIPDPYKELVVERSNPFSPSIEEYLLPCSRQLLRRYNQKRIKTLPIKMLFNNIE